LYRSFSFVPFFVLFIVLSLAVGGCGSGGESESSTALPSYCPVSSLTAGLPQSVGNDPPIAYRQQVYTDDDTACDVTFYACDPDQPMTSNGLSWVVESTPTVGSVTALGGDYHNPVIQYVPRSGFTGTDSFYYSVSDGESVSATKEIRVHISGNKTLSYLSMEEKPYVADSSAGAPLAVDGPTVMTAQAHFDNSVIVDVSDFVTWIYGGEFPPAVSQSIQSELLTTFQDWWNHMRAYNGPPLPTTITASYTYGGISTESSTVVTFGDSVAPVVVAPPVVTREAEGPTTLVDLDPPTAMDDVSGSDLIFESQPGPDFPPNTYEFAIGSHVVVWTITDAAGNFTTVDQSVVITHVDPPVITDSPGNSQMPPPGPVTVEATGPGTAVSLPQVTAYDSVDGEIAVTRVPADSYQFPVGTHIITWTATDSGGNTASVEQVVTVVDTTPPVITTSGMVTVEATGLATLVTVLTALVTDIADPIVTVSSVPALPHEFGVGTHTITWTAIDASNNATSVHQTIVVEDTTDPVVTVPADVTVEAEGLLTAVNVGAASATDLVDVDVDIINDGPAAYPLGTTVVTWTATDDYGNSTNGTQNVRVIDTTDPVNYNLEYTGDQVVTVFDDSAYLRATLYPEGDPVSFDDPADGTKVWFHLFTFEQMNSGSGSVEPYISVGPVDVTESVLHPGVGVAGYPLLLSAEPGTPELGTNEENYVVLVELGEGSTVLGVSQEATLTVYAPTERFFTGGGMIRDGETGEDNSFGFTIKFLEDENGIPVPKGNILYVRQDTVSGLKWRVLSESLEGAGFYPYYPEGAPPADDTVAIAAGLCRVELHDLVVGGDPLVEYGLDCAMKVEDLDESGIGADTFTLELLYPEDGVEFYPIHMGDLQPTDAEQPLTGGNVTIHDK
jgi:hypothetical protein